jgi:hypothetical protein
MSSLMFMGILGGILLSCSLLGLFLIYRKHQKDKAEKLAAAAPLLSSGTNGGRKGRPAAQGAGMVQSASVNYIRPEEYFATSYQ